MRAGFLCSLPVPDGGFRWSETAEVGADWLKGGLTKPPPSIQHKGPYLVPQTDTVHPRYPLGHAMLHRAFASLEGERAILEFANEWGFLGHYVFSWEQTGESQGERIQFARSWPVESLAVWRSEIKKMRPLLEMWDTVRPRPGSKIPVSLAASRYVAWGRGQSLQIRYPSAKDSPEESLRRAKAGGYVAGHTLIHPALPESAALLQHMAPGEQIEPVSYYVYRAVNERLAGEHYAANPTGRDPHVYPAVLPYRNRDVMMVADCLISALYCLFAIELTGKQPTEPTDRKCPMCGNQFKIKSRAAITCSEACRQAQARQKKKALTLWKQGHSLDDLVRTLDRDEDTVRGWVTKAKEAGHEG